MTRRHSELLKDYVERLADTTPNRRAALVDEVRREHPELMIELASMLPFIDEAERRLLGSSTPEPPGYIGRYRVVRLLAQGGMGEVYLALEPPPLGRQVAVKIIRPGFVSRQMVQRFEFERDALKALEHPHIARITDGGETDDGLPFVAMEYIDGISLEQFIATHNPKLSVRIRLMQQVCAAVASAHLKGVIHRDLKPGNVMVKTIGGAPHARVIDFGIAKALDHSLLGTSTGDSTTSPGFPIGTLEYMSPEQVRGLLSSVDRRSDIYALGAMLYWICTGSLARTRQQLLAWAGPEFLVHLDRHPIAMPSSRMDAVARDLSGIRGHLRELDWIILKALESEPSRRYQSVEELSLDLERWRAGEAIRAAPASRIYRIKKLVTRRPLEAGIAAAALVGVSSALVTLAINDARVRRALDEARIALAEREAALADADAAARFLAGMISSASPRGSRPDRTVTEMIDESAPLVAERLADAPIARWRVRQMLADTYRFRGDVDSAIAVGEEAVADATEAWGPTSPQRAESLTVLAQARLNAGQFSEARREAAEALRITEALGEPSIAQHLGAKKLVATIAFALGDVSESTSLFREVADLQRMHEPDTLGTASTLLMLVDLLSRSGSLKEAQQRLDEASGIAEQLAPRSPQLEQTILAANGSLAWARGDRQRATEFARRLVEHCEDWYGPEHGATLEARLAALSQDAAIAGSWQALLNECRAVERATRDLESSPVTRTKALHALARALHDSGESEQAIKRLDEAIARHRSFFGEDDATEAKYLVTRARVLLTLGRSDESRDDYRRALAFQNPDVAGELDTLRSDLGDERP